MTSRRSVPIVGCYPGQPARGWAVRDLAGDCDAVNEIDPPVSWPLALWPGLEMALAMGRAEDQCDIDVPADAPRH